MFNFGKPSSSSVYVRRFFFWFLPVKVGFVFCCFGGGALGLSLETRDLGPRAFEDLLLDFDFEAVGTRGLAGAIVEALRKENVRQEDENTAWCVKFF